MSRDAWFPLFHRDFRGGTRKLSLEERGAYFELLMLMYDAKGAIDDDEAGISAELGCDKRVWRRLRAKLLAAGKLDLSDGKLSNARALHEIGIQIRVSEQRTLSGALGGLKSGESRRRKSERRPICGQLIADFAPTSAELPPEVGGTLDDKPLRNKETAEALASIPQPQSQDISSTALSRAAEHARKRDAAPRLEDEPPDPIPDQVSLPPDHPRPKPPPVQVQQRHRDAIAACIAAAGPGLADPARCASLHTSAGRIIAALEAGCDLELDILPVIRARTAAPRASPVRAWGYFEGAWVDARNQRLSPPPNVAKIQTDGVRHASAEHDFAKPRTFAQQRDASWSAMWRGVRELYGIAEPEPELVAATVVA
ncbi:MAG: YdaU family protein [Hyphomonadaceae bacterium]|nr:YdaU family protein [Hyphomonadaceae bacterium]